MFYSEDHVIWSKHYKRQNTVLNRKKIFSSSRFQRHMKILYKAFQVHQMQKIWSAHMSRLFESKHVLHSRKSKRATQLLALEGLPVGEYVYTCAVFPLSRRFGDERKALDILLILKSVHVNFEVGKYCIIWTPTIT